MTRLSAHRRGYTRAWQAIARETIARNPRCVDCGSDRDLTGDHERPLAKGGLSTRANAVTRCRACNTRKRDRLVVPVQLTLEGAEDSAPVPSATPERSRPPCASCGRRVLGIAWYRPFDIRGAAPRPYCRRGVCLDAMRDWVGRPFIPSKAAIAWLERTAA